MKKIFKEYTVDAAGGTITLKANDVTNHYIISGAAVTLVGGLVITIDTPSKAAPVKIYWNQPVTLGVGGAVTILGNAITDYDTLENLIFDSVYDGAAWKNVATQNLSVSTLTKPIWNHTVTVNYDMAANDSTRRIFKTYADAITYINTQTPTTTDHWCVFMPSGLCNEDMTLYSFIDIYGSTGTVIKSVVSSVASTGLNIFDCVVKDCTVNKVNVATGKAISFINCTIVNQAPVPAATDGYIEMMGCIITGGDFSNTSSILPWQDCKIISLTAITGLDIDLTSCYVGITNTLTWDLNVHWRNSTIQIDTLNITAGCKITNCYFKAYTMNMSASNSVFYNSEVTGAIALTNAATLDLHNSESNGGNIVANDTSIVNMYGANEINGTITLNDAATLVDYSNYYDNTISGLTAGNTKSAIDELAEKVTPLRLCFASLDAPDMTTVTKGGAYYPIEGTFTNSPCVSFGAATVVTPGVKYTGTKTMYFEIDWHATLQANVSATIVSIAIKKNGVLVPSSVMSNFLKTAAEPQGMSGTLVVELATNDEIQLVLTSDDDADEITVNNFTTSIISIIA